MVSKFIVDIEDSGEVINAVLKAADVIYEANYDLLFNKPSINGVELLGELSLDDLGAAAVDALENYYDIDTVDELLSGIEAKIPSEYVTDVRVSDYSHAGTRGYCIFVDIKGRSTGKYYISIPTMLSSLSPDATHQTVSLSQIADWNAKSNFDGDYGSLTNKPVIPSTVAELTDAASYAKVADYYNKASIDGIISDVVEGIPTALNELTGDSTHRTVSDVQIAEWDAKSDFDGDYNSLSNKPTIPSTVAELTDSENYALKSNYYDKTTTDTLFNSHTPQLLFSGVTSASAPAVVDLSGYDMIKIVTFYKNDGGSRSTCSYFELTQDMISYIKSTSHHTVACSWADSAQLFYTISERDDGKTLINVPYSTITLNIYGITQHTVLAITTQPTDQTGAVGSTATFHVDAVGDGLTYQWQFSDNNGKNWYNVSLAGNKAAKLPVPVIEVRNGVQYRCIVTDKNGTRVISNVATLTVTNLAITTQPTDLAMTVGETDTFHVDAVGDELTYQWYISTDGGVNWRGSGTTGNKTDTLYINNAKVDYNGYKYKCIITDKYGATVTSDVATLTVTS